MHRLTCVLALLLLAACSQENAPPADIDSTGPETAHEASGRDLPAFFDCIREHNGVLLSAHRGGANGPFPENALESMESVLAHGPALIETDIAVTKDGKLILMHDRTLDRTTTGTGLVSEKTWEDLQPLRLVDNGGNVTDYTIPTFRAALRHIKGRGMLALDLKSADLADVMTIVDDEDALEAVYFIAYDWDDAREIKALAPDGMVSLGLTDEADLRTAEEIGLRRPQIVGWTGYKDNDPDVNRWLLGLGIEVSGGTYATVDKMEGEAAAAGYRTLAAEGITVMATDRPMAVLDALGNEAVKACW